MRDRLAGVPMTARRKASDAPARPAPKKTGRDLSAVIRVSRRAGREGDSFLAPDQQRDLIEAGCKRSGDRIVSWYDETDSVSGGTVDRVGLQAALGEALDGRSDGVIVAKVNRFARTKRAGEDAIQTLIDAGRSFIAVDNGIDSAGGKLDRGGEIYLDFLLRQAQWEREDLKANFHDVRRRQIARGIASQVPYGYRRLTKEEAAGIEGAHARQLVPHPDQFEWVVYMFERRAAGASWAQIARELDASSAPTPWGTSCWLWSRVRSLVNNRVFLGELSSGEFVNPHAHMPLVPVTLWESANGIGPLSERAGSEAYPLTGLVRCASCGNKLRGNTMTTGGGRKRIGEPKYRRYYRCRRSFSWGRCPAPVTVSADALEEFVLDALDDRLAKLRLDATQTGGDRQAAVTAAAEVLAEAKADLDLFATSPAIARAAARGGGAAWFELGIESRVATLEAARAAWDAARYALTGVPAADLELTWHELTDEEQRGLLARVFAVVAVKPAGRAGPIAERARVWARHEAGVPTDLPGRGPGSALAPIVF